MIFLFYWCIPIDYKNSLIMLLSWYGHVRISKSSHIGHCTANYCNKFSQFQLYFVTQWVCMSHMINRTIAKVLIMNHHVKYLAQISLNYVNMSYILNEFFLHEMQVLPSSTTPILYLRRHGYHPCTLATHQKSSTHRSSHHSHCGHTWRQISLLILLIIYLGFCNLDTAA